MLKKFKNITIATIIIFIISFGIANACGWTSSYKIITSNEKGIFEFPKDMGDAVLLVNKTRYPGEIKASVNGKFIDHKSGLRISHSGEFISEDYYLFDDYFLNEYVSRYYPKKFPIIIFQDGKEVYSANWKIYDVNDYWLNTDSHFMLLFLLCAMVLLIPWKIFAVISGKKGPSFKLTVVMFSLVILILAIYLLSGYFIKNSFC